MFNGIIEYCGSEGRSWMCSSTKSDGLGPLQGFMACLGVDGHGSYDLPLTSVPFLGIQPYFKGQRTGFATSVVQCHLRMRSTGGKRELRNRTSLFILSEA